MSIKELVRGWQSEGRENKSDQEMTLHLPLHDVARLRALQEMYPACNETELLGELIRAALDEVEALLPYQQGSQVVARDELGDPIFEDVGPSRRFYELTRAHLQRLHSAEKSA
ncbi:MAG: pilin assembly protein [Pseudomonadota bacterium]|nr:pilin assembly protein [Pseudomonadota bacterium]